MLIHLSVFLLSLRGHGGRVVTLSPPTSEAGVRFPAWPQVGKLVVACRWSAVYSTVLVQFMRLAGSGFFGSHKSVILCGF